MKGLIILDGPDGAGKTTLGKRICERFGGKYLHLTYRWKNNMFAYHTAALHHATTLATKQLVVIDRLWMSEVIYARVYRNGSNWPHMGRMMDRVVRKHAGMYVLCFDESMKEHQDRFMKLKAEREEMYNDTTDVWALYRALYYGGLSDLEPGVDYLQDLARGVGLQSRGDVWRYSIGKEGKRVDEFIEGLLVCLQLRQNEQTPIGLDPTFHNFLGYAPEAKYLLVGDRLSDKRFRSVGWPFYAYQHCSKYFAEKFSELNIDETKFCWTNASENYGPEVVDILTDTPYNLKPIFMGGEAVGRCDKVIRGEIDKDWTMIFHPQWYSRWSRNTFTPNMLQALRCLT